jgi:lactate permease
LFGRPAIARDTAAGRAGDGAADRDAARRRLFAACFLISPFAESATGFGIGLVVALALILPLGVKPLPALVLALLSQMMVPWGALAVGTMVGAHLSGLDPGALGWRSAVLTLPLSGAWLVLFWRWAAIAGLPAGTAERVDDVAWVSAAGLLLIVTNLALGAEVAALAALGPVIVLRFWRDVRPTAARWRAAARAAGPYAALVAILVPTRAWPALHETLGKAVALRPFDDMPAWLPLLHPMVWLLAVAVASVVLGGRSHRLAVATFETWKRGRTALIATVLFMVLAQVMDESAVARALAATLRDLLGAGAAMLSPVLAAVAGFFTGTNAASNGLLMPSQVALAAAVGLDLGWLAAIQNTIGSALTMLSPIRLAMGVALLGRPDLERAVYRVGWPLGAAPLALMIVAALVLVALR